MIDVHEHFYDDDPNLGHPDVRTRLRDVSYFFLGNGYILAAIQEAPSGEGTPIGLLIMNPDRLSKKRDTLTMDPEKGLENTMIYFDFGNSTETVRSEILDVRWFNGYKIPTVRADWQSNSFQVSEFFYCPDLSNPILIRELQIKNIISRDMKVILKTGVLHEEIQLDLEIAAGEKTEVFLSYALDISGNYVELNPTSPHKISDEAIEYWNSTTQITFNSPLLDHYFNISKIQQAAVISHNSVVDASIWQYNGEWVRDHSMMAIGLTLAGHHEMARKMLVRLFRDFVTEQGDTVDSSKLRNHDEVELDQNGVLIYALKEYVLWTGDFDIIHELWDKIKITAEFPLSHVFRHSPSGLLANQREFWERHRAHGIEKGMELTYQFWISMGLSAAALLAKIISQDKSALRWEREAERIKDAMLNESQYGLVDNRGFIKRRYVDGSVQEMINALPEAQLPSEVPLSSGQQHFLNPDSSSALPIAYRFIPPDSSIAITTMKNLETLWNQTWQGGGYGRYHISSEPDSPGAWPFPSLFLARTYVEMGDFEKVGKVFAWLNTIPGTKSGSWFEFYGPRLAPPFPQVGITPWTWAEMLMLLINHIIGVRPEVDHFSLRPRLLPGINHIKASFPFRNKKLNLKIEKVAKRETAGFHSNSNIIKSSSKEANISYSNNDMWVEAKVR